MRSLYSRALKNLAGKSKAETTYEGILDTVPRGIKQIFTKFESNEIYTEDDERFLHFTTKVSLCLSSIEFALT